MTINMASLGIGILLGVILTIMVISLAFNVRTYILKTRTAEAKTNSVSFNELQVATDSIMKEVETRRAEDEKKFLQLKADTESCLEHWAADYATKSESQYIAADIFRDAFEKGVFDQVIAKTAEEATKNLLNDIFGPEQSDSVQTAEARETKIVNGVDEQLIKELEEQYL